MTNSYYMPAEWERHKSTWLSWPHNQSTWPHTYEKIPKFWAQMIAYLSHGEQVNVLVPEPAYELQAKELLNELSCKSQNIFFHLIKTNDAWIRDYGAIFVRNKNENESKHKDRVALNFEFNMWGEKYPPWDFDNKVPGQMARYLDVSKIDVFIRDASVVFEGGSIEVNGQGLAVTTQSCLLNPNRNPDLNQEDIEIVLDKYLGIKKLLWLESGVSGDDTDGHIDDLTRFVSSNKIVTVLPEDKRHPDYEVLKANYEKLLEYKNKDLLDLDIHILPMPDLVYSTDHELLPASYANFYIANSVVLVPVFNCAQDQKVLDILQQFFKTRKIIAMDARSLVEGLGAIHCVTQQEIESLV